MNTYKNYDPDFTGRLWGAARRRLIEKRPCRHNWKTDCGRCSRYYWVVDGEEGIEGVCDIYLRENPEDGGGDG